MTQSRYLTFQVGDGAFAVAVESVLEVRHSASLAKVPLARDHLVGAFNLHGKVLPVFGMRSFLGLGGAASDPGELILVERRAATGFLHMALLVDAVHQVAAIGAEDIRPFDESGCFGRREALLGTARFQGRDILLLDVEKIP